MYYTTTIGTSKAHVFDTKDLNECKVVLSSSSKVATLSSLKYTTPSGYKEVARVNASIFNMSDSTHQGWEYSDVFKTSCAKDTRADVMQFKDGTIRMGDIGKDEVDLEQIEWAYSGSHVILQDGNDVVITASWREQYPKGKYCWSWFASREDGTYVIGALDESGTCNADELRTFLKGLGCNNAIVNDGGGSAELIVGGKIKNRTTERKIANGLFIYESTKTNTNTSTSIKQRLESLESALKQALEEVQALKKECL